MPTQPFTTKAEGKSRATKLVALRASELGVKKPTQADFDGAPCPQRNGRTHRAHLIMLTKDIESFGTWMDACLVKVGEKEELSAICPKRFLNPSNELVATIQRDEVMLGLIEMRDYFRTAQSPRKPKDSSPIKPRTPQTGPERVARFTIGAENRPGPYHAGNRNVAGPPTPSGSNTHPRPVADLFTLPSLPPVGVINGHPLQYIQILYWTRMNAPEKGHSPSCFFLRLTEDGRHIRFSDGEERLRCLGVGLDNLTVQHRGVINHPLLDEMLEVDPTEPLYIWANGTRAGVFPSVYEVIDID